MYPSHLNFRTKGLSNSIHFQLLLLLIAQMFTLKFILFKILWRCFTNIFLLQQLEKVFDSEI